MASRFFPLSASRRRHWFAVIGILLLAAIIYLLGNNLFPLVDRDEPRYAQASRQMLQSGDWITPKYLDELRLKKPIFIYWLQAGTMKFLGDTAFAARLPSVVASLLTLGLFALAWPKLVGYRRARWALFIFATMLLPTYLAKVCMTDAVLHVSIAASLLCLYGLWSGTKHWCAVTVALGLSVGVSMLTKGPPVFLYLGMTMLFLLIFRVITPRAQSPITSTSLPWSWKRGLISVAVVLGLGLVVCLPWVIQLERAHPGALLGMIQKEAIERGTKAQEGHTGPPGYYFVSFWATAFPWCLLWPAALWHGWKRRRSPWVRFCLAAILGPWVFLEIYKTKLPHYWLPSYPFMALLIADTLVRAARGRIKDYSDGPFIVATAIACGIVSLIGVGFLALPTLGDHATIATYLAAATICLAILACCWGVFVLIRRRMIVRAAIVMGLGFWAVLTFAFTLLVPVTPAFTLAQRVGTSLKSMGITRDVEMVDFKEPSLAFYQGGTIGEQSDNVLSTSASTSIDAPRWIVIGDEAWQLQTPDVRSTYRIEKTFRGMNLADGKPSQVVHLLEKRPGAATLPAATPTDASAPATRDAP